MPTDIGSELGMPTIRTLLGSVADKYMKNINQNNHTNKDKVEH